MKKYILFLMLLTLFGSNVLKAQEPAWIVQHEFPSLDVILKQIQFIDNKNGWLSEYSSLDYTNNGGITWQYRWVGYPSCFYFVNNDTGYVADYSKQIFRTYDRGLNWDLIYTGTNNNDFKKIFFSDPLNGWAIIENSGNLLHTTNGGDNWVEVEVITEGTMQDIEDVFFVNDTIGWITGFYYNGISHYIISKTINNGTDWVVQFEDNYQLEVGTIFFINDTIGWGGGAKYINEEAYLLQTLNGGETWEEQFLPEDYTYYEIINCIEFVNDTVGWLGTNYNEIFKTTDGGNTWNWEYCYSDEWSAIKDISMVDTCCGWAITENLILIKATCDIGVKIQENTITPEQVIISPNPLSENFNINSNEIISEIIIYSTLGKEIFKEKFNSNNINISLSNYSQGIYFIKINFNNNNSITKKIIKN